MTALLTDDATREAARLHVSDYCDVDQGAMEPETKAWAEGIYRAGARFAQGIYEARLAEREATIEEITQKYHAAIARELRTIGREQEVRAGLVEALEPLADLDDDDLNRHLTLEEIAVFRAALDAAKEIK